ncbi:MAG: hypothetical protein MK212_18285 [Saprospiraceae bacterium]|nr:hypothetical protein [Saprospiraceae bacterium]
MDLVNIKKHLEQLNEFYQRLAEKPTAISKLEKDRFLAYIGNLYDASWPDSKTIESTPQLEPKEEISMVKEEPKVEPEMPPKRPKTKLFFNTGKNEKTSEVKAPEAKEVIAPSVDNKPEEEPKVEVKKPVTTIIRKRPTITYTQPKAEPKEAIVPETKVAEVEVKIPDPIPEAVKEVVIPKPEAEVVKTEPVVTTPTSKSKVKKDVAKAPVKEVAQVGFNEEYEELFIFKTATDLLQKLGEKPISNLEHAIAIGKRYQFVGQLFGGDMANYSTTLDKLNNMNTFDEARLHIEQNLIGKYNWMSSKYKELAKDFVKLVRRRYLK